MKTDNRTVIKLKNYNNSKNSLEDQ